MAKVSALVTTALQVHRCELAIFVYSEVGKTATVMHFNFLTLKFNKTPPIVRTYTNINKVNKKILNCIYHMTDLTVPFV